MNWVQKSARKALLLAVAEDKTIEKSVMVPMWCTASHQDLFVHLAQGKDGLHEAFRVAPPQPEMQEVDGISFPKPLQDPPMTGTKVFQVHVSTVKGLLITCWNFNSPGQLSEIHTSTCHLTAEAALQHLSALMPGWLKNMKA